jgi:N-acetylmuramoyl-L-alanine amidase
VTPTRRSLHHALTALLLGTLTCLSTAQTPQSTPQAIPSPSQVPQPTGPKPLPAFYRNIIFLDPAHGGPDTGAHLPSALEKDIALSFSARLRTVLGAAGFTVLSTRDTDPTALITSDQRAGIANHARPLACLLLHATASGSGVHIVTSSLTPPDDPAATRSPLSWQAAQANTVPQSLKLADELSSALQSAKLPAIRLRASVPPIDSLTCAAAAIELAPLSLTGAQTIPVTDSSYQQQVAEAIAEAITSYRERYAPPPVPPTSSLPTTPGAAAR